MRGSHNPATEGSRTTACARCSAEFCTAKLANAIEGDRNRTRASLIPERERHPEKQIDSHGAVTRVSRGTGESLLPAPDVAAGMQSANTEEAIRPLLCKNLRVDTHNFVYPGGVMSTASKLASDGIHLKLNQNPFLVCNSKRARNRLWRTATRARIFLKFCTTVNFTSSITCARERLLGNAAQKTCSTLCRAYIPLT